MTKIYNSMINVIQFSCLPSTLRSHHQSLKNIWMKILNKTESHYRSARLVQAFKILEFKMMLRFNESCH